MVANIVKDYPNNRFESATGFADSDRSELLGVQEARIRMNDQWHSSHPILASAGLHRLR
jgi:hypothetical protein